jgi:guanine nucleotide-binding protein G(i) subunit alpha
LLQPQNDARRSIVLALPSKIETDEIPRDVAHALRGLWRDPGVRAAVGRSGEFQLNDNAVYYFNAIDRMSDPQYLPTDEDIIRSHEQSTGVAETTFQVGELKYRVIDADGVRAERKKWIHCFEDVTALVSLSEYDQMLYEDESVVSILTLRGPHPLTYPTEPHGGDNHALRLDLQLPVVCQDVDPSPPRRHRHFC